MFFRKLNWNIVGWFRIVSLISYLVIGAGIVSMVYNAASAPGGFQVSHLLRLGLSFTGGTDINVAFTKPATTDQVRTALSSLSLADEKVTTLGTKGLRFSVETQTSFSNDSSPLWKALGTVAPVDRAGSQIAAVGPSLGKEYLTKALLALVIALGIQFLYIAFRFGWNYIFGLVTVIALFRDGLMMIGIYSLAGRRADDAFLAAVLTVIGYSVMDTIVILDRIRENTRLMAGKPYDVIVNESIKQTMNRSLNTLATVFITLVALLALGGASLKNFAFALLVGITSGGYHSIFFSAPLVLQFRKRQLEAAAKKRLTGNVDRTVSSRSKAEAGALHSTAGMAREEIIAARRERRAKQKDVRPTPAAPVKYKRQRPEATSAIALAEHEHLHDEEMDPLDAQTSGMHDAALEAGHETVTLNLEGFEIQHPQIPHEGDGEHTTRE